MSLPIHARYLSSPSCSRFAKGQHIHSLLFFQTTMKKFQNCKVVIEDSTLLKLLYFISQMKSLRTWMTNTYLLDMSKAFNSIRHDLIPSKRQSIGVSNGACDWFGSYLSQRSQVVNMANSISDPSSVTVGVPQGSITGPVLFSFM